MKQDKNNFREEHLVENKNNKIPLKKNAHYDVGLFFFLNQIKIYFNIELF